MAGNGNEEMFKTTLMGGFDKDDVLRQVQKMKDETYAEKSKLLLVLKGKDKKIAELNAKLEQKNAEIERLDALRLTERFDGGEFTEIACDPPWGLYRPLDTDPADFNRRLVENLEYVLAPYGMCVVLTALKTEFASAVKKSGLDMLERFDILVNGKKAAIFVLRK